MTAVEEQLTAAAAAPCPLQEARRALETLPLAVATIDQHGIVRSANRVWRELAAAGGGLGDLRTDQDCLAHCRTVGAVEIAASLRNLLQGRQANFIVKDMRCVSRLDRWFDFSARFFDDGGLPGALLTLNDVTERHQALADLDESDARHRHAERIARLGHWRLLHTTGDWATGSIEYSPQAASILGLPSGVRTHDLLDMKRLIHPDDLAQVLATYERDVDSYEVEYRIVRSDGAQLTIRETGERMVSEGDVTWEFGTLQDVTDQRRDEDRLRRLNDQLEHLIEQRTTELVERESQLARAQALAKIGHYTWRKVDEEKDSPLWHKGLRYSPAAAAIFGVTPADLIIPDDEFIRRFVHPDDQAGLYHTYMHDFRRHLLGSEPIEYRIVLPTGEVRYVIEIVERMAGEGEEVLQVLGMLQDVTNRKRAELAQRDSEARLSAFMENAPFIMSIKDLEGRLQMINREGATSYDAPQDKLRGHRTEELMPDASGRAITAMSREVVRSGRAQQTEIELPGRDRYHWSLEIEFPIRNADGGINAIGGFAVDITEQKKAELALRESETRLRAIFDHVPVTLSLSDTDGRYTMVNRRFLEKLGREEADVIGHTALDIFGPMPARRLDEKKGEVIRSLKPVTYEARTPENMGNRDCVFTHFPILHNGVVTAVGTISLDLTEQRAAEAALQQAQKMELVGQLTGGMAHDFNNLLGAIIGNLDLLALQVEDRPAAAELVARAVSSAERGAALIQRLLAFSRRQTLSPRFIDINEQIQGMRQLLEHSLGPTHSITIRTSADHPFSRVDQVQLEAAILNLAVNARDAMPAGGRLTIETANVTMAIDPTEPVPTPQIMIVVADNGTGMTREVLQHVFEPFFTTKPVGKGSGLGLSMVHGFAKQSGGHVEIDSQVGRGTTVGLFLPCASGEPDETEAGGDHDALAARRGQGEKILIVEDDPGIMSYCSAALQQLGYQCVTASDGAQAMQALAQHGDIALIFSDIVLPGPMNGAALVVAARRQRPDIKVLFTSGFNGTEGGMDNALPAGDLFLAKPYRISELSQIIADMLSEPVSVHA